MEGRSVVGLILALVGLAVASVVDNQLDGGERVVLVAPVLAPPRDSRAHVTDRARQFPILVLLAQRNPLPARLEPEPKSLRSAQPIYVQKLEDQQPEQPVRGNRQKRHLLKKHLFGGGGGYGGGFSYGGGGGYGGDYGHSHGGGYETPSKIVVVKVVQEQGYHQQPTYVHQQQPIHVHQQPIHVHQQPIHVHEQQPSYVYQQQPSYHQQQPSYHQQQPSYGGGGCGGGCGGNGGGGSSSATATATATAHAQSGYGKR